MIALLLATWLGDALLGFFGIGRPAFQVAGGLIVVLIGLSMLRSEPSKVHHDPDSVDRDQDSAVKGIVPRGIPLLAGLGRTMAYRRTEELRPEAEAIAAQRVRDRVRPRFDEEVDERLKLMLAEILDSLHSVQEQQRVDRNRQSLHSATNRSSHNGVVVDSIVETVVFILALVFQVSTTLVCVLLTL